MNLFRFLVPLLIPAFLQAEILSVGDCSSCNYTSIQTAIDAASSGDTISVEPGVYEEDLKVVKTGLAVIGSDTENASVQLIGSILVAKGVRLGVLDLDLSPSSSSSVGYLVRVEGELAIGFSTFSNSTNAIVVAKNAILDAFEVDIVSDI